MQCKTIVSIKREVFDIVTEKACSHIEYIIAIGRFQYFYASKWNYISLD